MLIECNFCYNQFNKPRSHVLRCKKSFCSKFCFDHYQTESIVKHCIFCEIEFTVRRSEYKKYVTCSSIKCRRLRKYKENNPNWRGGISNFRKAAMSTLEYKEWRRVVFERDNYTCLHCSKCGSILNADHIKPWAYFPELRYDVTNGRTLCLNCHKKTYKEVFKWRNT